MLKNLKNKNSIGTPSPQGPVREEQEIQEPNMEVIFLIFLNRCLVAQQVAAEDGK